MDLPIKAFGAGGFRSIFQTQYVSPCAKINIFAGSNNSGKSNVLRFLSSGYSRVARAIEGTAQKERLIAENDTPKVNPGAPFRFVVLEEPGSSSALSTFATQAATQGPDYHGALDRLTKALTYEINGRSLVHLEYAQEGNQLTLLTGDHLRKNISESDWRTLGRVASPRTSSAALEHWISQALKLIRPSIESPPVRMIPAFRQITDGQFDLSNFSGSGLISELARLQNPGLHEREEKQSYLAINDFARRVTGDPDLRLEIPYSADEVIVFKDGRELPIEALGTGIHEVIMLATVATLVSNEVVCLEEPELHLHPLLQRELLLYLATETTNQYFITTHSAHILDTPGAQVFHVELSDGATTIKPPVTPSDRFKICQDLGYRASDIIQANCIIWVEGPSDRIYVRRWIEAVEPELIEGLHYAIMFYGGRLLCQLSANDAEVSDFIALQRINRNIAVVMDSDRPKKGAKMNATKLRVRKEVVAGGGFIWVTAGREVENYINSKQLCDAINAVHPTKQPRRGHGQFDQVSRLRDGAPLDKVKVARVIARGAVDLEVLDLRSRLDELIDFIRRSN